MHRNRRRRQGSFRVPSLQLMQTAAPPHHPARAGPARLRAGVRQPRDAVLERPRVGQLELLARDGAERALAPTEDYRVDDEAVLVDQAEPGELLHDRAAAERRVA